MENLSFKVWLSSHYEIDELKEIAEHGCASYAPSGMLYYFETIALYDRFCEDLHETLGNWVDEIGFVPTYITQHIGDASSFKNAMVWAIAEYHANDLIAELEVV